MKNRLLTIIVLGLLAAIGPFSIDMYLPSFPAIAADFQTEVSTIGLSLSSFFVGISLGQMIYGPLLDRYGRKKPLYIGLVIYLLTSLLCAYAWSAEMLIATRFFQALGSCVGMVASRALIRDLFPVSENAKIFSFIMLVIAVSPILAPTAGGLITVRYGWPVIFIVLAAISVIILFAVYFFLPSGNPPNEGMSLKPRAMLQNFKQVAIIPKFYVYSLVSAISASGLYAYIAGSPMVFMGHFQVSEEQYGWLFSFLALGMVLASLVNTLLLKRYSSERIIWIALAVQSLAGSILLINACFFTLHLTLTILLIWIFLCMQGFVFPNSSALAMAPFSETAGTASALMGAVQLGIGAVATAAVSAVGENIILTMVVVMAFTAIISLIINAFGQRLLISKHNFKN